ncbi:chorismate--pyruvate lyase family protein [Catenovulum sediminis]|uniref:chorismate--pyruvate lyase family protein n=1 Tax=Catenovulum sediminis TaxID=1740262 RepID=UPI001FE737A3|nr:chorismate lyase [Catenovulum sediminis]
MTFPVGDSANWQPKIDAPEIVLDWLLDPASLTAKLKSMYCNFSVQVLGQCWLTDHNKISNSVFSCSEYLVREVLLICNQQAMVYAHTCIPKTSLTQENLFLTELGTQPLGEALFARPDMRRTNIELAIIPDTSRIYKFASQLSSEGNLQSKQLYGRRSIFELNQSPLSVAEIFLPTSPLYNR